MGSSTTTTRPRLAVVVANDVTGGPRAERAALAAARDGWDVTLVTVGGKEVVHSTWGRVATIRVPVKSAYRLHHNTHPPRSLRARLTQFGLPTSGDLEAYRAAYQAWQSEEELRLAYGSGGSRSPLSRVRNATRRQVFQRRDRAWRRQLDRFPAAKPAPDDWRNSWPKQIDFDLALLPVLVKLAPEVIHVGDVGALPAAAKAAARLRARGHKVGWLYDAHEYVRGVERENAIEAAAVQAIEHEFIRVADAVVTVSPGIAEALRTDHDLRQSPIVAGDVPIRSTFDTEGEPPSLRTAAGIDDETPLIVYAGVAGERDLSTVVKGLFDLPEVHLAVVAKEPLHPRFTELLKEAGREGALSRVHVVPPVADSLMPAYLAPADLGLIGSAPLKDRALESPGNLGDYVHAGVPVIGSSDTASSDTASSDTAVGVHFASGDVPGFVDAVRRGLTARAELAARIGEEIRAELSWEHQSEGLVRAYRKIAPRVPENRAEDVPWSVPESDGGYPISRAKRTWRHLGDTPVRLGIGPANFAGQAALFAHAVCRQMEDVSAEVFMYQARGQFGFPADLRIKTTGLSKPEVQLDLVERILGRYTHLIADAFLPVFGNLHGRDISADLPLLTKSGIKVALLAHGTEIRHPLRHMSRHESSHFHDAPDEALVQRLIVATEKNRRTAEESGLPLFVTTPDLLDDLPTATWAPLVVDVDKWRSDRPVMERKRPIVLHAPSARWTKGTERILPVLEEMDASGAIELRLIEGLPWDEMRDQVRDADLVLDQFATSTYGTVSVEAMAAGRPVLAYLGERLLKTVGPEPPIVNATPATLRAVIEELLDDRDRAARIGAASAEFARKYHDGTMTGAVLGRFLHGTVAGTAKMFVKST